MTAAINACSYDAELRASEPLRQHVRGEVAQAVERSGAARATRDELCRFYKDHQQPDPGLDLAQYVSLALNLGAPPRFDLLRRESDLPPDAAYVLGMVPILQRFYPQAGLGSIWQKHRVDYEALVERYHEPVARMILTTDVYLKMPSSRYVGRQFDIYIEPLAAPGQVNSRNFGSDYFMVIAPENGSLRMPEIRHTYLHYLLDPLTLKRANSLKKLDPLLSAVKNAPMADEYKHDTALLVTECLIRAIEARTLHDGKAPEAEQRKLVEVSTREGFVLTGYFYAVLGTFEKEPTSLKDAFGDLLYGIDVGREKKLALEIRFSPQASPEVVRASRLRRAQLLDLAEERLVSGDLRSAERMARQALDEGNEDPARALFILARAATLDRDVEGARTYFERTLAVAREPRLVAWSHIYLGRIFDLQDNRESAVQHYRAALAAGDTTPDTKAAAEHGLKEPYQPPAQRR
ncbi:MAG: tetratricopeptide repeat protein [Acidobacteriia bacterium]|nr:tetratricopeptide repeat protein [Terriglobia bacterium]